jgi:Domain of unknown function (DUF4381)
MKFLAAIFSLLAVMAKAAETNELPALAPAYGEIPPTVWEQHGTPILIGGFVFIVLASLAFWKMLQPKTTLSLPPEVLAREALAKLQHQPEDGKLLSEVSQILRRYVVAAFELSLDEMTTVELCTALAANNKVGTELAQSISDFLRECDNRKFSPAVSVAPSNTANRALELISFAEKRRAKLQVQILPPK